MHWDNKSMDYPIKRARDRCFKAPGQRFSSIALLCVWIIMAGSLQAASPDMAQLQTRMQRIHSLSGDFSQVNTDLLQDRKSRASGRFAFHSPGLMRWEYQRPDPYSIIVGSELVWIHDPVLENVTIHNTRRVRGLQVLAMLFDPQKLQSRFITIEPQISRLALVPGDMSLFLSFRKPDTSISEIQIAFGSNYLIKEFVIVENNGNFRRIRFSNLQTNPDITASDFIFQIPKGVEIIDKTGEKP